MRCSSRYHWRSLRAVHGDGNPAAGRARQAAARRFPGKYVPDAHADWDKATIRQLLGHTAGVASFTSFPGYSKFKWQPAKPDEIIARFRDKPLEFEPGTQFEYSNSGYYMLGYIVERVSGKSYET